MLKRFLLTLASLVLCASVAQAGWNIRQDGSGDTYWVEGSTEIHVGETHLTLLLENVSTASSAFVISPITGYVDLIWGALFADITTANTTLKWRIMSTITAALWADELSETSGPMTFTTSAVSKATSVSWVPTSNNYIQAGGILAVYTNAESTNDVDAVFTIRIRP